MTAGPAGRTVVAFDLDDTLCYEADYVASAFDAVSAAVREAGGPEDVRERLGRHALASPAGAFDLLAGRGESGGLGASELVALYRAHRPASLPAAPGALFCLEHFRRRGFAMALVTDGRSVTQRNKLAALGLGSYFGVVVVSEEVGSTKPDVRNFTAVERHYPAASLFWYVGDNPRKDFVGCRKLGWKTVRVEGGPRNIHPVREKPAAGYEADHVVTSLDAVPAVVDDSGEE